MPSEHLISSTAATPSEHTVAWVFGQPVTDVPQDLFIPPDALKVVLSSFQGPL
ncbi:segregation/condensation protein A, partial [Neisseria sp. P0017.S010]